MSSFIVGMVVWSVGFVALVTLAGFDQWSLVARARRCGASRRSPRRSRRASLAARERN